MPLGTILVGVSAGISYALSGYAKSQGEQFDYVRFGTTTMVGIAAGILMYLLNLPIDTTYQYLVGLGIVPIFDNFLKTIQRRILTKQSNQDV